MEAYSYRSIEKKKSRDEERTNAGFKVRARRGARVAAVSATNENRVVLVGRKKEEQEKVEEKKAPPSLSEVLQKSADRAFRGGVAGFAAGVVQVLTFMWLRTTMNYQYANGGNMMSSISALYQQGSAGKTGAAAVTAGVGRFYQGVQFAIIQNPLSRFGDTAMNTGVLAVMDAYFPGMSIAIKTAFASVGGSCWRIGIMPVDAFKTTLQVHGKEAVTLLQEKVKKGGVGVLYNGAAANFAANWVGNYPWFATFNALQEAVPAAEGKMKLVRNAVIGIISAAVSDCVSNSLRVIKTVKQTSSDVSLGYMTIVKNIVAKEGVGGLMGRGLKTRLITNMLQSMVFSVAWKAIEEELSKPKAKKVVNKLPEIEGGATLAC